MATLLYAIEVPARGGDTLFANMSAAYEALSEGMKNMLDGLRAIFTASKVHGAGGLYSEADHPMAMQKDANREEERHLHHDLTRSREAPPVDILGEDARTRPAQTPAPPPDELDSAPLSGRGRPIRLVTALFEPRTSPWRPAAGGRR